MYTTADLKNMATVVKTKATALEAKINLSANQTAIDEKIPQTDYGVIAACFDDLNDILVNLTGVSRKLDSVLAFSHVPGVSGIET